MIILLFTCCVLQWYHGETFKCVAALSGVFWIQGLTGVTRYDSPCTISTHFRLDRHSRVYKRHIVPRNIQCIMIGLRNVYICKYYLSVKCNISIGKSPLE